MYFYDTNALLSLGEKVFDSQEPFYVSQITLQELEDIKTNRRKSDDVKYRARHIVRLLDRNIDKWIFVPYANDGLLEQWKLDETPDNKICMCAYQQNEFNRINHDFREKPEVELVFVTGDLCCRLIAKNVFGLNVQACDDPEEGIYKGYKEICGTTEDINKAMDIIYESDFSDWCVNEYLIVRNTDDGSEKEMRFDGTGFVNLKLPPSRYVKGKNALQRCALDILNNQDITIAAILGQYGSGKSYLTMRMGLYAVQEKGYQSQILMVRSPEGEGKDPGALPGDLDDKVGRYLYPFAQQLDGKEYELDRLRQMGVIDYNIPYYMKGTSYPSTVMICDEAEDLDGKQLRLVGTRVGEDSRIFFSGDYRQSIVDISKENALVKMCEHFKGNKNFACIYLDEDVRSSTSKMFADLFME